MRIHRSGDTIPGTARGCVLALGSFDGFHRGHQSVVGAAASLADDMNAPLAVLTTEPHPRMFFQPDLPSFLLTPFRTKAHLLESFGVEHLFSLPFTAQIAAMPAQDFVMDILLRRFGALHLVFGYDYRFGKGRGGGADVLAHMGEMEGFGVTQIDPVGVGIEGSAGDIYSSTLVRAAIGDGMVRRAASLLGHWWCIEGHVQSGDQRGRTIGFPTANFDISDYLKPKFGVYAVRARIAGSDATVLGVANVGKRPTFDKQDVTLEVHLFDFEADLYGKLLEIEFVGFIRPEQKFDGLASLQAQIAKDSQSARLILRDPDNAPDRFPSPHRSQYAAK